jgi:hypothetical protein
MSLNISRIFTCARLSHLVVELLPTLGAKVHMFTKPTLLTHMALMHDLRLYMASQASRAISRVKLDIKGSNFIIF